MANDWSKLQEIHRRVRRNLVEPGDPGGTSLLPPEGGSFDTLPSINAICLRHASKLFSILFLYFPFFPLYFFSCNASEVNSSPLAAAG